MAVVERMLTGAALQLEPAVAVQLHVETTKRNRPAVVSVTVAFAAVFGPLFVTTIVYVTPFVPRATVVRLSVIVTARSAGGVESSSAPMSTGMAAVLARV